MIIDLHFDIFRYFQKVNPHGTKKTLIYYAPSEKENCLWQISQIFFTISTYILNTASVACTEARVLAESKLQVLPNITEKILSKHTDVALPQKRTGFDIPFSLKKAHFIYDNFFCQDE